MTQNGHLIILKTRIYFLQAAVRFPPESLSEIIGIHTLADQVKNLDWQAGKAIYIETIDDKSITEIQEKLIALIG